MSKQVDVHWVLQQLEKQRAEARQRMESLPLGSRERAEAGGEAIGLAGAIAYVGGLIQCKQIDQEVASNVAV